jgi:hypothetical protein
MSPRLLIHIGYHKTATTWMQRRLFTADHGYRQICGHAEVDAHIIRPHGLLFDPGPMRALIASALARISEDRVPVISSEILSGNPFYAGWGSDVFAERLGQIAPEARILVSIRTQMRILPSVYMQYLSRGGTMTAAQFFAGTTEFGYVRFDPEHFEYDRLIGLYRSRFGRERVFVLPQESLLQDREAVLARLAEFCGNAAFTGLTEKARRAQGVSYPEHAAPFLRRLNHLRRDTLNPNPIVNLEFGDRSLYRAAGYAMKSRPLVAVLGRRKSISEHVRRTFAGYFSASNQRLKEMVGPQVDLSDYA